MSNLQTINFHNHNLYLIEHDGQPFTPMKPIVRGMGLNWSAQLAKLRANSKRWGVLEINIPSKGGEQKSIAMPLRKLPAWLAGIYPKKVKPELRETIELYQEECDDALWSYWSEGHAVNPRATITPEQQRIIQETVAELAHENKAYAKYYGALKSHFRIGTYKDLPADKLNEALEVLQGVVIEQKALISESFDVPEGMVLVSEQNLKALTNRVGLIYERHQQIDEIRASTKLAQAALEVVREALDEYTYRTNDAVREANLIARHMG